jgi:hypothetical protein
MNIVLRCTRGKPPLEYFPWNVGWRNLVAFGQPLSWRVHVYYDNTKPKRP